MSEEKTSKRNGLILLLSGLLLLTCIVTGIYALYKSSGTESSTAQAAKWGVSVTAGGDSSNVFKSTYDGENDASVVSSDTSQLTAAPGTSGYTDFSITGTPEVALSVSVDLNTDNALSMITGPADVSAETKSYTYHPIKWTLKKSASVPSDWSKVSAIEGCDGVSLETINTYLTDTAKVSKSWAANTDLSSRYGYYRLSWSWPYSQDQDAEDTYIGDVAAGTKTDTSVCTTEAFKLKITVTQLDTYVPSQG